MFMKVLARYLLLIEKTIATVKRSCLMDEQQQKQNFKKNLKVSNKMGSKDKNRESIVSFLSKNYVKTHKHFLT